MELFLAAAGLIVSAAVLILFLLRSGRERQAQDAQLRQIEALTAQQQAFGRESAAQLAAFGKQLEQLARQTADEFGRNRRDTLQYQQQIPLESQFQKYYPPKTQVFHPNIILYTYWYSSYQSRVHPHNQFHEILLKLVDFSEIGRAHV